MLKILKKNVGEIFSFLCTVLILLFVFKIVGIFEGSIIISDLEAQIYPLINQFTDFFSGKMGLFNFNFGLGDTFLGTLYYYLMTPFNFLFFFIKNSNILFITIIILKAAFSSLFCFKFLKYQDNDYKIHFLIIFSIFYGLSSYFVSYNMIVEFLDVYMILPLLLLGIDKIIKEDKYILYVGSLMFSILCSYYFAYMVCIFSFLYFNYKTLICKIKFKELIKNNGKFIFISFLACLSMSFVLLPIASEIGNYSREDSILFGGEQFNFLFNLKDIVNHYILGNLSDISLLNSSSFYAFSSIIILPLVYFYYINKNISLREKVLTSVMFFIFLLSIGTNYFNYAWHGFLPPCCFNGRFTFLFILFGILISFKSLCNLKDIDKKHYIIIYGIIYLLTFLYAFIYYPRIIDIKILSLIFFIYFGISIYALYIKKNNNKLNSYLKMFCFIFFIDVFLVCFKIIDLSYFIRLLLIPLCVFLVNFVIKNRNVSLKHFFYIFLFFLIPFSLYVLISNSLIIGVNVLFRLILLLIILLLLLYRKKIKYLDIILIIIFIIEITFNCYGYLRRYPYNKPIDTSYEKVIDYIKNKDESKFYRIEDNFDKSSINYTFLYDYNGMDYFISNIKKDYVNLFLDLDLFISGYTRNSIFYDASYHLLSSLLNVKYYVEHKNLDNEIYTKINSIEGYDIYENTDSLEFGYMVDENVVNVDKGNSGIDYINDIYKTMTNNNKDLFTKIKINNNSFINTSSNDFYIVIRIDDINDKIKSIDDNYYEKYVDLYNEVYINNELVEKVKYNYVYKLDNNYELGEQLNLSFVIDEKLIDYTEIYLYYYNHDIYKEDISILKSNQLNITNVGKSKIDGVIDVKNKGILFMSCLYNEDLEVYVDGVKQQKIKLFDTFIGVNLDKGEHEITLKYNPRLFLFSFVPSLISFGTLIVLHLRKRKLI